VADGKNFKVKTPVRKLFWNKVIIEGSFDALALSPLAADDLLELCCRPFVLSMHQSNGNVTDRKQYFA